MKGFKQKIQNESKMIKDCELFPSCWGEVIRTEEVLGLFNELIKEIIHIPAQEIILQIGKDPVGLIKRSDVLAILEGD